MEKNTHCWGQAPLQASYALVMPGLSKDIDGIIIYLYAATFDQLSLKLESSFSDLGRI
jgi:hypothetical protein